MDKKLSPYVFYQKGENFTPRTTVVGRTNQETGEFELAVSRCSHKDQFIKARGRLIATNRLEKGLLYRAVDAKTITGRDFVEMAKQISEELSNSTQVQPVRVQSLKNA